MRDTWKKIGEAKMRAPLNPMTLTPQTYQADHLALVLTGCRPLLACLQLREDAASPAS